MKKVLSLAFIAAVLLLGCSADGFFDEGTTGPVDWGKQCKVGDHCFPVQSKKQCDDGQGLLVSQSQCPQD